jgi:hypothetical protein
MITMQNNKQIWICWVQFKSGYYNIITNVKYINDYAISPYRVFLTSHNDDNSNHDIEIFI